MRSRLVAGFRRYFILLGTAIAVTALGSFLLGLATGTRLNRAISLGFYVVGCFGLVAGFFLGNRGPARFKGEEHGGLLGPRHVRWATLDERTSSLNDSALFVSIGFLLLLVGLAIDSRVKLI
jgi:hypothetical protein